MTFIQSFRVDHGLELNEFARVVNNYRKLKLKQIDEKAELCGLISAELVHMLEVDKHCVTHPAFADAISTVVKATPKQRDSIVHEKHRGQWQLDSADDSLVLAALMIVMNDKVKHDADVAQTPAPISGAKAVVKIDYSGNILHTYPKMRAASLDNKISDKTLRKMCLRKKLSTYYPYTFRYADEWAKMSNAERIADANRSRLWDVVGSNTRYVTG